jgi:hypothetical protein
MVLDVYITPNNEVEMAILNRLESPVHYESYHSSKKESITLFIDISCKNAMFLLVMEQIAEKNWNKLPKNIRTNYRKILKTKKILI